MTIGSEHDESTLENQNNIPKYISEGLNRQPEPIISDIVIYTEELIEYVNQPPSNTNDELTNEREQLLDSKEGDKWTQVQKEVDCGKQCSGCPHGPYLYLVRRVTPSKLEWKYIGPVSTVTSMFPDFLDDTPNKKQVEENLDPEVKKRLEKVQSHSQSTSNKKEHKQQPDPPSAVPEYIVDGIASQDLDTLNDIIHYSQEMMEHEERKTTQHNISNDKYDIQSHDEIEESSWSETIKPTECTEGDIVEIIHSNDVEYQTGKIVEITDNKMIVITENDEEIEFDKNGYSDDFDALNALLLKDSKD